MAEEIKTEKIKPKKETKTMKDLKTPFYKKALFPWMIIVIVAVFFLGNINGWVMRGNQQDQVNAEASHMLTSLKPSK